MRGVPGLHVPGVLQSGQVMMADDRRAFARSCVQLPHVVSPPAVEKFPDGSEPVRTSVHVTGSPRPLTTSPFRIRAVCLLTLLCSECRSFTLFATTTPLAFCHGPFPIAIARGLRPRRPRQCRAKYVASSRASSRLPWRAPCNAHQRPPGHRDRHHCLCPRLVTKERLSGCSPARQTPRRQHC